MTAIERISLAYRRVALIVTGTLVVVYVVMVLVPVYMSGIDRLSSEEIWNTAPSVPIYSQSGSVRESMLSLLPVFVVLAMQYLVPVFLALFFIALLINRKLLTRKILLVWIVVILFLVVIIYITLPVANSLLIYLVN